MEPFTYSLITLIRPVKKSRIKAIMTVPFNLFIVQKLYIYGINYLKFQSKSYQKLVNASISKLPWGTNMSGVKTVFFLFSISHFRTTPPKKGLHISSDLYLTPESRITFSDSSPTTKKRVSPKKQKRSYITLNEDKNSKPKTSESGSSKRSISTAGMDAIRKALGTSTEEKRKEKVKKEKSALKRNAVGSAIFVLFLFVLFVVLWFWGFGFEV